MYNKHTDELVEMNSPVSPVSPILGYDRERNEVFKVCLTGARCHFHKGLASSKAMPYLSVPLDMTMALV
jgi:hypothetical protein